MALAELIMRGAAVDQEKTPGPAVDITLVIEATPHHGTTGSSRATDAGNTAGERGTTDTTGAADTTGPSHTTGASGTRAAGDATDTTYTTGTTDATTTTGELDTAGTAGATDTAATGTAGTTGDGDSIGDGRRTTGVHGPTDATGTGHLTGSIGPAPIATDADHLRCGDHADPSDDDHPHPGDQCCGDGHAELARLLASRPVSTPDGHHVPAHVAAALVCDPAITALIVDTLGVPLDLGRTIRFANRAQRRALARRDGGCVFPGCDAPVGWCDAHHVTWWDNGGKTDIGELALLCRYHHGISHRHGWTMTAHPDHTFTWTTPLGQTLTSQRHRGRSPTGGLAA